MSAVAAAVAAHQAAREAFAGTAPATDRVAVAEAGGDLSDEAMAPARVEHEAADAAEREAWNAVVMARPASLAELAELIRYIGGSPALDDFGDVPTVLGNLAEAAEGLISEPDTELVRLGVDLGQAWADEIRQSVALADRNDDEAEALYEAAFERTGLVVDAIATLRATTLAGLGIQALAVAWCEHTTLAADLDSDAYDATSERINALIRRTLIAVKPAAGTGDGA